MLRPNVYKGLSVFGDFCALTCSFSNKLIFVFLSNCCQCHQQSAGNTCGFYTAYHMLEAMEILGLDNSLVQINFSQWFFVLDLVSACTNQLYLYLCLVLKIFYWNTQDFEVMTNPIDQDVVVKIRERIASFIMSQVINLKGEFHCDNPGLNYIWTKKCQL